MADLYSELALEFNVTRSFVKTHCFVLMYSIPAKTQEELKEACRALLRMITRSSNEGI